MTQPSKGSRATNPVWGGRLKPEHARFVEEYLRDHNATQAYMRAYGVTNADSANAAGARLLAIVSVRTEVKRREAELLAAVQAETRITLERTVREIARGAFFDPRKFFTDKGELRRITDLDEDTAAALAGFDFTEAGRRGEDAVVHFISKVKLVDRKGYLDMLMKHLGGYSEDNRQKGAGVAAEALRAFFGALHSGAGRIKPVRLDERGQPIPPKPLLKV